MVETSDALLGMIPLLSLVADIFNSNISPNDLKNNILIGTYNTYLPTVFTYTYLVENW